MDRIISEYVNNGALYVGVSAGSILAGPDISIASPFDENDVNLKDLSSLSLTEIIVSPHYDQKDKSMIGSLIKKSEFKVIPITDEQALKIVGDKEEIIG